MTSGTPLTVSVPEGFGIAQMVLHFEAEDLSTEVEPFAGNVVVQLRTDAETETTPDDLLSVDLRDLSRVLSKFERVEMSSPSKAGPYLEFTFEGDDGMTLQQSIIYLRRGEHMYTVVATHKKGARFDPVRAAAAKVADSLS